MIRKLLDKLLEWKNSSIQKPIILTGARGVGKTYIIHEFAKDFYKDYVYLNFEQEPYLYKQLFDDSSNKCSDILVEKYQLQNRPNTTLIILDEIDISYCDYIILKKLKSMFCDNTYHFILITSKLKKSNIIDFDFTILNLYPLDFEEFLLATGDEWYIEVIREHYHSNKKVPDIVHKELLALFNLYIEIGGMPLAVNEYINTKDKFNVFDQHRILLGSYHSDISYYTNDGEALKIQQVLTTLDKQLLKTNRKFQYTLIRKGSTYAMYSDAINYIQDSFYGLCSYKLNDFLIEEVNHNTIDIFHENVSTQHLLDENKYSFKLYIMDTGMLYSIFKSQYSCFSDTMKKGLVENYVAQTLVSSGYPLYFWESNSQAKIDFIIKKENNIIPIEVKITKNTRSKNVSVFKSKCNAVEDSIKISTRNFDYSNHVKYIPIYAVFCI